MYGRICLELSTLNQLIKFSSIIMALDSSLLRYHIISSNLPLEISSKKD
jgi:hypothetical protein